MPFIRAYFYPNKKIILESDFMTPKTPKTSLIEITDDIFTDTKFISIRLAQHRS